MCPSRGMVSVSLMSNTPAPAFSLKGEYTLGRATKAALCLWASRPQCCFYETWLGQVKLGHLVPVLLTHTYTLAQKETMFLLLSLWGIKNRFDVKVMALSISLSFPACHFRQNYSSNVHSCMFSQSINSVDSAASY